MGTVKRFTSHSSQCVSTEGERSLIVNSSRVPTLQWTRVISVLTLLVVSIPFSNRNCVCLDNRFPDSHLLFLTPVSSRFTTKLGKI